MKLVSFIVCDDVRTEVGNKHSLIGVYDDSINFNVPILERGKWPKALKLGIFVRAKFESHDEKTRIARFRLECFLNENGKTLAEGVFSLDGKEDVKGMNVAIVLNQFPIEAAGNLRFRLSLLDKGGGLVSSLESTDLIKVTETVIQ